MSKLVTRQCPNRPQDSVQMIHKTVSKWITRQCPNYSQDTVQISRKAVYKSARYCPNYSQDGFHSIHKIMSKSVTRQRPSYSQENVYELHLLKRKRADSSLVLYVRLPTVLITPSDVGLTYNRPTDGLTFISMCMSVHVYVCLCMALPKGLENLSLFKHLVSCPAAQMYV